MAGGRIGGKAYEYYNFLIERCVKSGGRCWQCGMGAGEPEAARLWIC